MSKPTDGYVLTHCKTFQEKKIKLASVFNVMIMYDMIMP